MAAFWVAAEPARKGKAELREAALGADRKLRNDEGNAGSVGAEEYGRGAVDRGCGGEIGEAPSGVVVGEELAGEIIAQVAAAIVFADECCEASWQLPFKIPTVGVAADARASGECLSVKQRIGVGGRNGGQGNNVGQGAVRGPQHNGCAMPLFKAEEELRGSNARSVIEFKLTDDAAFDLRRVAVRALAFAVTQLVGDVGGGRSEADGGQNDGGFRHDLEPAEVMCVARAELRSAFIGIAKSDSEAGGFQHVGQG